VVEIDDAQSIYKKRPGLGFSLSSVGIKAQGRTAILKANYRNTREILAFAYAFARDYIDPQSANDDHIPLIEPMAAGNSGLKAGGKRVQYFGRRDQFYCGLSGKMA